MRFPSVFPALILVALGGAAALVMPALAAGPNLVQGMKEAGEILPFEVIRDRVIASVRGEYVGAEFDAQTRTYRFRFVKDGTLFNVDVDARSGERVSRRQRF